MPPNDFVREFVLWAARLLLDQSNGSVTLDSYQGWGCWPGTIFIKWWILGGSSPKPLLVQGGPTEIVVEAFCRFWNVRGSRVESDSSRLRGMRLFHCPLPLQPTGVVYWWRTREHPFVEWKPANSHASDLLSSLPTVTLSAAPPSYFRGFTLIALKENREGDKEEDHAGTFQVRRLWAPPWPSCPCGWKPGERWTYGGAWVTAETQVPEVASRALPVTTGTVGQVHLKDT